MFQRRISLFLERFYMHVCWGRFSTLSNQHHITSIFPVLIATSVPHKLQILNYAMIEKKCYIPHVLPTETVALFWGQSWRTCAWSAEQSKEIRHWSPTAQGGIPFWWKTPSQCLPQEVTPSFLIKEKMSCWNLDKSWISIHFLGH